MLPGGTRGSHPACRGGVPCLTLKDAEGGIVAVLADDSFDVRSLKVGKPGAAPAGESEATLELPLHIGPGRYDVFLSVGTKTGTPTLALPLPKDDGDHRYRVGTIELAE